MSGARSLHRIDSYPTHQIAGFGVRVGRPFPFGATLVARRGQLLGLLEPAPPR